MATPAIQDIARYGEYTEALRQELEDFPDVKSMAEGIESLPLLDSFLKESLRVNHSDACMFPGHLFPKLTPELRSLTGAQI